MSYLGPDEATEEKTNGQALQYTRPTERVCAGNLGSPAFNPAPAPADLRSIPPRQTLQSPDGINRSTFPGRLILTKSPPSAHPDETRDCKPLLRSRGCHTCNHASIRLLQFERTTGPLELPRGHSAQKPNTAAPPLPPQKKKGISRGLQVRTKRRSNPPK